MKQLNSSGTYDNIYPVVKETGYTKNETLQDATKNLFGLTSAAVPDDVFELLGHFANNYTSRYVWKKEHMDIIEEKTNIDVTASFVVANTTYKTVNYSSQVTYDQNNKAVLVNPQSITISLNSTGAQTIANLAPTYIETPRLNTDRKSTVIYLPEGSTGGTDATKTIRWYAELGMIISSYSAVPVAKYVTFASRFVTDGYVTTATNETPVEEGYTFIGLGQLGNKIQTETGSYVGTGSQYTTYNTLTFTFSPKIVIIQDKALHEGTNLIIFVNPSNFASALPCYGSSSGNIILNQITWNNNTISWKLYENKGDGGNHQLNISGHEYVYIAFG